jgi:RNA polymerase sigma factor (sigma-70 family)
MADAKGTLSIVDRSHPVTDTADIDRLYKAEYLPMLRLAHLLIGTAEIAEEVVQDAFIVVYQRREQIENLGGYLRRTVVNRCYSELRRRSLERRKAQLFAVGEEPVLTPELDETWKALDRLKPKQRTALVLRYYEDLPIKEVAELMGEREGTVKSLVHRGLNGLRSEVTR